VHEVLFLQTVCKLVDLGSKLNYVVALVQSLQKAFDRIELQTGPQVNLQRETEGLQFPFGQVEPVYESAQTIGHTLHDGLLRVVHVTKRFAVDVETELLEHVDVLVVEPEPAAAVVALAEQVEEVVHLGEDLSRVRVHDQRQGLLPLQLDFVVLEVFAQRDVEVHLEVHFESGLRRVFLLKHVRVGQPGEKVVELRLHVEFDQRHHLFRIYGGY